MKIYNQKTFLTDDRANANRSGEVTQRFVNNRASFVKQENLQAAANKKYGGIKQLKSNASAKHVLNKNPIQRMIKWNDTGKIEEIRIDRPAGSAIGHHTSAYLLFIEAIESNLINSDCKEAITKIRAMAKDLRSYPGYDKSNKNIEKLINYVVATADDNLSDLASKKLNPMNYTYTIENLSLLFLDARNKLDYTTHEDDWGSKGGKKEATHIKNFSVAFQSFDENNYTKKDMTNLAELSVDLIDTDRVDVTEKKDYKRFSNIVDQHLISHIVAHPTLENIQKPLAIAIGKELKRRGLFDSTVTTKVKGKKGKKNSKTKTTRVYNQTSKDRKKETIKRLRAVNGWKKLSKHS